MSRVRKICLMVRNRKNTLGIMDHDGQWSYYQNTKELCSLWQRFRREDINFIIQKFKEQIKVAESQKSNKNLSFREILGFLKKHQEEKKNKYHFFLDK